MRERALSVALAVLAVAWSASVAQGLFRRQPPPETVVMARLRMAGSYCDILPTPIRRLFLSLSPNSVVAPLATPETKALAYAGLFRLSLSFSIISCLGLSAAAIAFAGPPTPARAREQELVVGVDEAVEKGQSPDDVSLGSAADCSRGSGAIGSLILFFSWDLFSRRGLPVVLFHLHPAADRWTSILVGQAVSYAGLLCLLGPWLRSLRWSRLDGGWAWTWAARGYLLCALGIPLADSLVGLMAGVNPFLLNPTLTLFAMVPPYLFAPLSFCLLVAGPIVEELLFRGYLLRRLSQRWGPTGSLVATSALFALGHATLWSLPSLFCGGMILGWVAQRSNSLTSCVLAHAAWNLTWLCLAMACLP